MDNEDCKTRSDKMGETMGWGWYPVDWDRCKWRWGTDWYDDGSNRENRQGNGNGMGASAMTGEMQVKLGIEW